MADHAKDPNKNQAGIPKEDKHHEVAQHINSADPAISRIELLLAHDRHPKPERVAELIAEHPPGKHEHVFRWLHQHFGNSYVHEVQTAGMKTAKHAQADNVSVANLNPKADHAKTQKGGDDPNRMTDHGAAPLLALDTAVYRGDGTPYNANKTQKEQIEQSGVTGQTKTAQLAALPPATAIVQAHAKDALRVVTGAVKTMQVPDASGKVGPQKCVLCFQVGDAHVTGWVPVWAIEPTHAAMLAKDEQIADEVASKGKDEHYAAHASVVHPKGAPHGEGQLRIMANQVTPGVNMADHYCERPGGVVNLLANVPGGTGGRMGVAIDVLTEGTHFHRASSVAPEHTPLYESGDHGEQTDKLLTFVYGKVEKNGQTTYGWINKAMLKD